MTGDRLKIVLGKLEMTQTKLAELLGVKVNQINRWATDNADPSVYYLIRIQEKTGLSIDWLLSGKGGMFLPDEHIEESSKEWICVYFESPTPENIIAGLVRMPTVKVLKNTHPIKFIRDMQKKLGKDFLLLSYKRITPEELAEIGGGALHWSDMDIEKLNKEL